MGFRLVPKSVTLDDLEQCNGMCSLHYFAEFGSIWAYYVKVVGDTSIHSGSEI